MERWRQFLATVIQPRPLNEDEVRQEYMTRLTLVMAGLALLPFTLVILIGWGVGAFPFVESMVRILWIDLPVAFGWWLMLRGHWRWAGYIVPVVFLLNGVYGTYFAGLLSLALLFFVIAILLTAMLHGGKAQWFMMALSIGAYLVAGWLHGDRDLDLLLPTAVTVSGSLIGIALLQWLFTSQLKQALTQAGAYNEQLIQEIAERKQAEEAVRESEEKYRRVVENANEAIVVVQDEMLSFFNPKALELIGYSSAELASKPFTDLIHPEDRAMVVERYLRRLQGDLADDVYAFRIIDKEGNIRWAEIHAVPVDWKGRPATLDFLTDITGRKRAEEALQKSEERFRSIVQHLSELVLIVDEHMRIKYETPSCSRILGYEPGSLIGKVALEFVHPDDLELISRDLEEVFRKENQFIPTEFRCRRVDGRWIYLEAVANNMLDHPSIQGIIVTAREITERKQEEKRKAQLMQELEKSLEELKQTQSQLVQAQKMEAVGRLAGGVAHDFNNLLTVIQLSTQIVGQQLHPADPLWEHIQQIQEASERGIRLTKQLLSFSRQEVIEPQPLDLSRMVGDLGRMLQRIIGEDIELVMALAEGLWPVKADPSRMEQVIVNLAVNARDAMPEGGRLTIETANVVLDADSAHRHLDAQPGEYVMLAVSDTGLGMDEEVQAHIFEPFFTAKEQREGGGLELSTVYGIVTQNAGYIWLHSEAGQGATFSIYLPRAESAQSSSELPSRPLFTMAADTTPGTETILVVEDEAAVRRLAVEILQAQGYRVLAAGNGIEALQASREHGEPIHLLLTDVVMPKMNGKELVARLRPKQPTMRVLYMSGYSDDVIAQHDLPDQSIAFLPKPFSMDTLIRKVRALLDGAVR